MAEDHSKYMPHHSKFKPKSAKTGKKFSLEDPMIRARSEPTSHDGSGDMPPMGDYASQQTEPTVMPGGQYYGGSPAAVQ